MNVHQCVVPAEITGEAPLASFGETFGGRADFNWGVDRLSWAGNLDAPMLLPTGGIRPVVINGVFEGMASRCVSREEL
jgi:hypothetical protein